jgi:lysophosphatidate acyltransferase
MSLWAFPEGTRNSGQPITLLPFKHGLFHMAAQSKIPIVPIVFENYSHLFDVKNKTLKYGNVAC